MFLLITLLLGQETDIAKLIQQLGDEQISVRESATMSLRKIGIPALEAARKACESRDAEVRQRAQGVVDHILFRSRGQILFAQSTPLTTVILAADPETPKPRELIRGPRIHGTPPHIVWLPNRCRIAISLFTHMKDARCVSYPRFDLMILGMRENEPALKLVEGEAELFALSPDQSMVACSGSSGGFYLAGLGGTHPTHHLEWAQYHSGPAWSPDGRRILFAGRRDDVEGLFERDIGANSRRLIAKGTYKEVQLSPDGTTLYLRGPNDEWTCRDSTTGVPRTTRFYSAENPEFSPDGQRMIIGGGRHSGPLLLTDLEGKNAKPIAEGFSPSWSPDGKRIVYQRGEEEEGCLFILDLASGGTRELVKGYAPVWTK